MHQVYVDLWTEMRFHWLASNQSLLQNTSSTNQGAHRNNKSHNPQSKGYNVSYDHGLLIFGPAMSMQPVSDLYIIHLIPQITPERKKKAQEIQVTALMAETYPVLSQTSRSYKTIITF